MAYNNPKRAIKTSSRFFHKGYLFCISRFLTT
jgi:hypothetical protein